MCEVAFSSREKGSTRPCMFTTSIPPNFHLYRPNIIVELDDGSGGGGGIVYLSFVFFNHLGMYTPQVANSAKEFVTYNPSILSLYIHTKNTYT